MLVQGVPATVFENRIYEYNPSMQEMRPWDVGDRACFFDVRYDGSADELECFADDEDEARLRFLAARELLNTDPAFALACSGNELARISWFVTYQLNAVSQFADRIDKAYPLGQMVDGAIDCILASGEAASGWPTTKYSVEDGKPLSLLVDDAMILQALLSVARSGLASESQVERITTLARTVYDRHESDWMEQAGGYRFTRGISFSWDGVVMPFNQQNVFGLALLDLYDLTGEDRFKDRALRLAASFRQSWEITKDSAALWHYWPADFYKGWTEADGLSVNTPSRKPSKDVLYEDNSHAGINVDFALTVRDRFDQGPFSSEDINFLRNTLDNFRIDGLYSLYISGDTTYFRPSTRFIPAFGGWTRLKDTKLKEQISKGLPKPRPYFENSYLHTYLAALDQLVRQRNGSS